MDKLVEAKQIDRENGSVQIDDFYIDFFHYAHISAHTFTDLLENCGLPLLLWKGIPFHTKQTTSSSTWTPRDLLPGKLSAHSDAQMRTAPGNPSLAPGQLRRKTLLKHKYDSLKLSLQKHLGCLCTCAQSLSHVHLSAAPWTVAHQAPLSMGFPRQ